MNGDGGIAIIGAEIALGAVILGIGVGATALVIFAALLVRAARYPFPVPLIAPLSMLALVAMIIGGFLEQAQELITVAAAAVGALAAALTTVFKSNYQKQDDDVKGDE